MYRYDSSATCTINPGMCKAWAALSVTGNGVVARCTMIKVTMANAFRHNSSASVIVRPESRSARMATRACIWARGSSSGLIPASMLAVTTRSAVVRARARAAASTVNAARAAGSSRGIGDSRLSSTRRSV